MVEGRGSRHHLVDGLHAHGPRLKVGGGAQPCPELHRPYISGSGIRLQGAGLRVEGCGLWVEG